VSSETSYVARSPRRQTLRFSKSGNPKIDSSIAPIGSRPSFPSESANVEQKAGRAPSWWWFNL